MKKSLVVLSTAFVLSLSAHAANHVSQCVYPKTKVGANGQLVLKHPVYVLDAPSAAAPKRTLTTLSAFTVKADAPGGFVRFATVPNYDLPNPESAADKVIGWAKLSDFDLQDLRNCN
ncbi:hypothetical protein [Burkholderia ubonensis]|uniref:hypothetical protein n=1 Tax=Burkholderia ubonensis TaxID=101571 RepID=UPI000F582180|nr:hypothetical protein [Burkholderia ubonensis]RQP34194.1 hypothetical protein DF155_15810 [Burkholderia ubonensis]RQP40459.1 hypothetical protein DF154_13820 [Burkholderia ubonensis]RQP40591.1 hypothetical protein DF156_16260 [Burkholderia ubonensis]RQP53985.1 hypothetical protein DF144_16155 [Burkholderia ubonensis]RQP57462.1 hypothetical protein DF159_22355 [Burkholderia ubonensis]